MEIKRVGSQPSAKGPPDWFTGTVRIDPLFQAPDPALVQGASGTFEPLERLKIDDWEPDDRRKHQGRAVRHSRGPAVKAVAHIRRNTLFTRDADETRNEAVIAVAMYRGREAHHRRQAPDGPLFVTHTRSLRQ